MIAHPDRIAELEKKAATHDRRLRDVEETCRRIRRAYRWMWGVVGGIATGAAVAALTACWHWIVGLF